MSAKKQPEQTSVVAADWAAVTAREAKLHGLAKDAPWVEANAAKMAKLFPNQALMPMACLLAASDETAIDYLRQAPVLVLAAMGGKRARKTSDRLFIANKWKSLIAARPKLRDLMRLYGLAVQLRALKASSISVSKWRAIQELSKIAPSSLAQIIPQRRQATWLMNVAEIVSVLDRRQRDEPAMLEWAARALCARPMGRRTIFSEVDFLLASRANFNPRWTWEQLVERSHLWHHETAMLSAEQRFFAQHGKGFNEDVPCAPFPERAECEGRLFIPLRSGAELYGEGMVLHHCVGSYSADLLSGAARIVSVRGLDGKRLATAEFRVDPRDRPEPVCDARWPIGPSESPASVTVRYIQKWQMVQIKAYCNADPDAFTVGATMHYGQMVRAIDKAGGYTSFQILSAPQAALFVWSGEDIAYPVELAAWLNRLDLAIMPAKCAEDIAMFQRAILDGAAVVIDHRLERTADNAWAFEARAKQPELFRKRRANP